MEATLGKRIAAYRKKLSLTQDQLAEKLGITAQAVSKWENDLSCPDITMLPKLADIFDITIDTLLGRETEIPVSQAEIVTENSGKDNGFTYDSDSGKMDFHWEGIKLEGIGFACWVILTGILYLITQLLYVEVSFWNIAWPSFLLMLGVFGLYPKFSAFRLGCALVGGYFLLDKMQLVSISLDNKILIAVAVLLFGVSLLADALRKNRQAKRYGNFHGKNGEFHHDYTVNGNHFTYEANFGENTQPVHLEVLQSGDISTNFGEYTVDLTGIGAVENNCRITASCNFGELTLLVPRCYSVIPDSSTSFAGFEIKGQPDSCTQGIIHLDASVSFGEICIRYI